ncbi:MAG: tRNA (guanosine(37)-N1)-methyltransferase TrmD [Pseudomonadota bacterium]
MSTPPKSYGRKTIRASVQPRDLLAEGAARPCAWQARVLTLYPEMFPGTLGQSLLGRALAEGLWRLEVTDIRQFATDKHRTVDDTPAGGGPGMVLRPDVVARAIDATAEGAEDWPRLLLSPRGRPFDQAMARRLAAGPGAILIAGRFEGVDERVIEGRDLTEISLGDFVLTGGEIAAQALIDATVRLIPRVLGNACSTADESHERGLLEHPHYTRPQVWEGRQVPEVLLSGHHARIAEWRLAQAKRLTKERRPDLWRAYGDPAGEAELSDAQNTAQRGPEKDRVDEPD